MTFSWLNMFLKLILFLAGMITTSLLKMYVACRLLLYVVALSFYHSCLSTVVKLQIIITVNLMQSAHLILFIISYANAHIVIITSSCIAALAIYSDSGNCYSCNGVIIMCVCVSVGLIGMTMSSGQ